MPDTRYENVFWVSRTSPHRPIDLCAAWGVAKLNPNIVKVLADALKWKQEGEHGLDPQVAVYTRTYQAAQVHLSESAVLARPLLRS
jgi:hypothetical protein